MRQRMCVTGEVFVGTIPICSATAFVLLVTDTSSSGLTAVAMTPVGRPRHGFWWPGSRPATQIVN